MARSLPCNLLCSANLSDNPAALDPRITGRNISEHSNTSRCLSLANEWLKACIENHADCSGKGVTDLPSRVIDLHPRHENSDPYLLVTRGHQGRYATLSHCWGPQHLPPLTTTMNTLERRCSGISVEELPASFKDAFYIAKRLGIDYLWIDSLCIIQDSENDWAEQSTKMADIYGNSFLTIAASRSSNSHAGIFSSRETFHTGYGLPYKSRFMKEEGTIYFRQQLKAYIPGEESDQAYISELEPFVEPLLTRAWVLQERVLSPRTLNYGTTELFWECNTLTAHESMSSIPERFQSADMKRSFVPRYTADDLSPEVPEPAKFPSIYTRWYTVLQAYTRLHLTYESDKFSAISGLAKEFERQTGDEYVAGMWKRDLHRGILWRPGGVDFSPLRRKFSRRRPEKWRAPSWSWASWDGPMDPSLVMHRERMNYARDARFINVPVMPTSASTIDGLKDGVLKLEAFYATVTLGSKGMASFKLVYMGTPLDQYGYCAILDKETSQGQTLNYRDEAPAELGEEYICVQIGLWNLWHHKSSKAYRSEDDTLYCLLLSISGDGSTYVREGVAYLISSKVHVTTDPTIKWMRKEIAID